MNNIPEWDIAENAKYVICSICGVDRKCVSSIQTHIIGKYDITYNKFICNHCWGERHNVNPCDRNTHNHECIRCKHEVLEN